MPNGAVDPALINYLTQVGSAANAVLSFALVQNVALTFALFSSDVLRRHVVEANWRLMYVLTTGGPLLYVAFMIWCCNRELALLYVGSHDPILRETAIGLATGRCVFLAITAAALVAAVHVTRREPIAGRSKESVPDGSTVRPV